MDDALEMTLLFDYYGELLTDKQRACLDLRYNQDLSLGEIAQELGISRQGVYDNLSRAEAMLKHMEEKTGFLRREEKVRTCLRSIREAAEEIARLDDPDSAPLAGTILSLAGELEE